MLQINHYKKYMLTEDNINKNYCNFLHNNENMKNYNKKNEKYNNTDNKNNFSREKTEYYVPYSNDKLFWCFYKIINESWDEKENFRIEKVRALGVDGYYEWLQNDTRTQGKTAANH